MFPDFLGIGAQKAGTSWLEYNLRSHPQIWMPPRKELHYFDKRIKEAEGYTLGARLFGHRSEDEQWRRRFKKLLLEQNRERSVQDFLWEVLYSLGKPSDGWYASLFRQGKGKVKGEITPSYSVLSIERLAHIYALMPQTRLIFLMRNPIERVWSQIVMNLDNVHKVPAKSAGEHEVIRRFKRRDSHILTDYLKIIENWSIFYPQEQIFVGFTEDLKFCPTDVMRRLYRFLGVDPKAADHSVIHKKIHSRSSDTMPTRIASHIARLYLDDIEELSERFGGYASFWAYCARNLSENPPEQESIEYPLYQSALWQEWKAQYLGDEKSIIESKPQSASLPNIKPYP